VKSTLRTGRGLITLDLTAESKRPRPPKAAQEKPGAVQAPLVWTDGALPPAPGDHDEEGRNER